MQEGLAGIVVYHSRAKIRRTPFYRNVHYWLVTDVCDRLYPHTIKQKRGVQWVDYLRVGSITIR